MGALIYILELTFSPHTDTTKWMAQLPTSVSLSQCLSPPVIVPHPSSGSFFVVHWLAVLNPHIVITVCFCNPDCYSSAALILNRKQILSGLGEWRKLSRRIWGVFGVQVLLTSLKSWKVSWRVQEGHRVCFCCFQTPTFSFSSSSSYLSSFFPHFF